MNTAYMIIFIVLCALAASLFIFMRIRHVGLHGFWTKLIASLVFVVGAVVAIMLKKEPQRYMYFIVLGLLFGLIGDMLLELKLVYRPHDKQYTNGGILSFSIGHVGYIVALTMFATATKNILVPVFVSLAIGSVLATIIVVNSPNLGVDFGIHKGPAFAYSFILCITMVYAVALAIFIPSLWIMAVGLFFFLASDLVLSLIYWGGRNNNVMNIINLSMYYVAQILIMTSLFLA